MPELTFKATLYTTRTDREGETRVQLDVPKSDLEAMAQLMALTETPLEITVRVVAKQLSFGEDEHGTDN